MFGKIKRWIIMKYLPAWCREALLEENRKLLEKTARQAAEIDRLNAYIDGVTDAMRHQPRIVVHGGDGP